MEHNTPLRNHPGQVFDNTMFPFHDGLSSSPSLVEQGQTISNNGGGFSGIQSEIEKTKKYSKDLSDATYKHLQTQFKPDPIMPEEFPTGMAPKKFCRNDTLKTILDTFRKSKVFTPLVVYGPRGIGKRTVVVQYGNFAREKYDWRILIDCSSEQKMREKYLQLAHIFKIIAPEEMDLDQLIKIVHSALSHKRRERVFVAFVNLDRHMELPSVDVMVSTHNLDLWRAPRYRRLRLLPLNSAQARAILPIESDELIEELGGIPQLLEETRFDLKGDTGFRNPAEFLQSIRKGTDERPALKDRSSEGKESWHQKAQSLLKSLNPSLKEFLHICVHLQAPIHYGFAKIWCQQKEKKFTDDVLNPIKRDCLAEVNGADFSLYKPYVHLITSDSQRHMAAFDQMLHLISKSVDDWLCSKNNGLPKEEIEKQLKSLFKLRFWKEEKGSEDSRLELCVAAGRFWAAVNNLALSKFYEHLVPEKKNSTPVQLWETIKLQHAHYLMDVELFKEAEVLLQGLGGNGEQQRRLEAELSFRTGQYDQAIKGFKKLVRNKKFTEAIDDYFRLGDAYLETEHSMDQLRLAYQLGRKNWSVKSHKLVPLEIDLKLWVDDPNSTAPIVNRIKYLWRAIRKKIAGECQSTIDFLKELSLSQTSHKLFTYQCCMAGLAMAKSKDHHLNMARLRAIRSVSQAMLKYGLLNKRMGDLVSEELQERKKLFPRTSSAYIENQLRKGVFQALTLQETRANKTFESAFENIFPELHKDIFASSLDLFLLHLHTIERSQQKAYLDRWGQQAQRILGSKDPRTKELSTSMFSPSALRRNWRRLQYVIASRR